MQPAGGALPCASPSPWTEGKGRLSGWAGRRDRDGENRDGADRKANTGVSQQRKASFLKAKELQMFKK